MTTTRSSRRHRDTPVTADEVAKLAGVSTATVSRVLNKHPRVGPEAQAAVVNAIEQLGYVPNRAARSLMTRRTDSVGVVILETADRLFGDPFFGQLMLGISAMLSDLERQLVVMTATTANEETRVERYLRAGHVDGAILVGPHGKDPLPRRLVRSQLPIVVNGRRLNGSTVSYVDAANRAGAASAVGYLAASGRRVIATIHGTLDLASGLDRLDGYHDALTAAGWPVDPALEAGGDFSPPIAADAMRALLDRRPDLDAVFVASDSMAAAALRVLQEAGRRVPEDVAVVGFDDTPVSVETRPTLSTVRQPIQAMGREMVRLVLQQIEQPSEAAQQVVFGTELVLRQSTDAAPSREGRDG
jgi:DNA-binding LacI/PurR family transcriptional regulator